MKRLIVFAIVIFGFASPAMADHCRKDIRVIQALLGHHKLETTALYTRVATGMISAVDSPLDDLGARRRTRRKAGGEASG